MANELLEFLPAVVTQVTAQLENDEKRWGDTWKDRPRANQEERIYARFEAYYDQWRHAGTPVPWLKIIGLCVIALMREQHPEVLNVGNFDES